MISISNHNDISHETNDWNEIYVNRILHYITLHCASQKYMGESLPCSSAYETTKVVYRFQFVFYFAARLQVALQKYHIKYELSYQLWHSSVFWGFRALIVLVRSF